MTQGVRPATDSLVGRRRELASLRSWLDETNAGRGRLVLCVGEPGIGKTRLAQEVAGQALAGGTAVAWGRCVEAEGAPAYWPWRQVLRSLDLSADAMLTGSAETPEERFRLFDEVADAILQVTAKQGLVVILDDVHWADEPSLLLLRHFAERIPDHQLLLIASLRDAEPAPALQRLLPALLRSPAAERLDLRGFDLGEVREQLAATTDATDASAHAPDVLDATGGNPFYVREIARSIADGTWTTDRPPRTVLDVVAARVERVSPECRRFVQTAAIVGRDFPLSLVAAANEQAIEQCLPLADEALGYGLVLRTGDRDEFRFVHALTRDAVEASLSSAERVASHRAVAGAIETHYAAELDEHLADVARHWLAVAPYGDGPRAREWAVRAADEAVRRLAYEEGVRLYEAALAAEPASLSDAERFAIELARGRAAHPAGQLATGVDAASAAAAAARALGDPTLLGEAALIVEAVPDPAVNARTKALCEEALAGLPADGHPGLRARLLALRSHLAFYDGEQNRTAEHSAASLALARESGDDLALVEALRARQEACPGPEGRGERLALADEMLAAAGRTGSARTAMWGELWRCEALLESGRFAAARDELPAFQLAVERVGGPVSRWHYERTAAAVAQAQGRFAEAHQLSRRGYERMRVVEVGPASGAFLAQQCALAQHVQVPDDVITLVSNFQPLPRFRTLGRLSRAQLFLRAGRPDDAAASYTEAGPIEDWAMPVFFVVAAHVIGALVALELGRRDDLAVLLEWLEEWRGEQAGHGVAYMGPIELTLGRGAAALGNVDAAIDDLSTAVERAAQAGAPGFAAEARYHLARALLARSGPGDRERAAAAAVECDQVVQALGMTAYTDRSAALLAELTAAPDAGPLSGREAEVAALVAEGLTNRQIAERLVISERTAQNHVQHILTKLGFSSRSQIAAWAARGR